jgi:hypothetical protein
MISSAERLRQIRTFEQLVEYLSDELNWPIEQGNFDDLVFEWDPDELGIDPKNAVKIQEIKQLRPLITGQPWGIFFIKFAPKQLPIVVLRRILGQLVVHKRASARKADQKTWAAQDLLFISAHGEGGDRELTFAHFSDPSPATTLPTLRVLGWDEKNTNRKLDHVAEVLRERLSWPAQPENDLAWRNTWSAAFELRPREVIGTTKELSVRLAELARVIRERISGVLAIESEQGPITQLMKAFRESLVHDLDADSFADMYAQTIAYGLLSARIADPRSQTADDLAAHLRTSPFLQELMEAFLKVGGRRGKIGGPGIDFDELGVSEVVELLNDPNTHMQDIVRNFGDRNPQEDPVIHFYELFLKEYDARKRMQRGVFYTPRPVVSYIVRSVDELLRTKCGLEDGLADITTWGEMAERHKGLRIPKGVPPGQGFVQILDPATGTGTFLVEAIDLIHKTLVAKWGQQGHNETKISGMWNEYVPRYLLPRLHGYELLMAPYAIAHLKIALKLGDTGYHFRDKERVRVYLTNSLEPAGDMSQQALSGLLPALAHEAQAVREIKRSQQFTVVIGNPPYAVEGMNKNSWIERLMDLYREDVRNEHNIQLLSDDYAKFLRLAHSLVAASGCGVVGMITKNTYLNTTAFRGLRKHLLSDFQVAVLDLRGKLYGKTPAGTPDTNVFEIRVGVAVLFAWRDAQSSLGTTFLHNELNGLGAEKLALLASLGFSTTTWASLPVDGTQWILEPLTRGKDDEGALNEYLTFVPLLELAVGQSNAGESQGFRWGGGVKTNRDFFLVGFTRREVERNLEVLASPTAISKVREELALKDGRYWNTARERRKLSHLDWKSRIFPYLYGPFDGRFVAHIPQLIEIGRGGASKRLMRHFQVTKNIGLVLKRRNLENSYHHAFVTRWTSDINCLGGQTYVIPLEVTSEGATLLETGSGGGSSSWNFSPGIDLLLKQTGVAPSSPYDVLSYVYAVLHSPFYRARYGRELRKDFPRLPLPGNIELFRELARLGDELIALHLLESPSLKDLSNTFTGSKEPKVQRIGWSAETVWLDAPATKRGEPATSGAVGFRGVRETVWKFHIGGYQVCEKWLKDRKGRKLLAGEIEQYNRIVVALSETIRIMGEIDHIIEANGGWLGAFQAGALAAAVPLRKVAEDRQPPYEDSSAS